jgi:glycerophosphoryl diester phosphodiesterase
MSELVEVSSEISAFAPPGEPLDEKVRTTLEGVYAVDAGSELFGDSLVLRWVNERIYAYSGSIVVFAELAASHSGDSIRFSGGYHFVRSAVTGKLDLEILPKSGGASLLAGEASPIELRGKSQEHNSSKSSEIRLRKIRPLRIQKPQYHVIGHRAGARNSDRLGRSENSIEMALYAEALGCTGIEIDIKVTKDDQLIVFHDDSYSPRTVRTTYILGNVRDFTLAQVRRNARLIYGEQIPTLDEMLRAIIDQTGLTLVWLDVKDPEVTSAIIAAQSRALEYAASVGRSDLRIYLGIASEEALSAYYSVSNWIQSPVICELPLERARSISTCAAWAPRWTNGLQIAETEEFQSLGKEVFTWTLDSPEYMQQFLRESKFNGILTNYPTMLAGAVY